ncbi:hypothetical protein J2W70_002456 [Pseudomonas koreensis]|uniref:hypothetical protein n=1 Tax=Pseudomonas koreensis TaxID=198620 RepID=UPI00285CA2D6|nr:hypothetical protein [Pseudomonas koreensis]MDR7055094.1 hypothetical protein [Pseudomonas koreensis]
MTSDDKDRPDPEPAAQQEESLSNDFGLNSFGSELTIKTFEESEVSSYKPPPVELLSPDDYSIESPNFAFKFKIPWDGHHQVWVDYFKDGNITYQISGEWFEGRKEHTINFAYDHFGAFSLRIQWRLGKDFSDYRYLNYYVSPTLTFDDDLSGFTIRGYGGHTTTARAIHVKKPGEWAVIGADFICGARWNAPLDVNYPPGRISIGFYQFVRSNGNLYTKLSIAKPMLFLRLPVLQSPSNGQKLHVSDLKFSGVGHTGLALQVVRQDNHYATLSESAVSNSESWQLSALKGGMVSGSLTAQVQYQYPGIGHGYSEPVTFTLINEPTILLPLPLTVQDTSFVLKGNTGWSGAAVNVYMDGSRTLLGSGEVPEHSENWEVSLDNLPPGSIGVVVEQVSGGVPSDMSQARGFRIRPPALETPKVEFPAAETVQFSGTGHYNPRLATQIRFIVKSYPGDAPPNTPPIVTVQNDGSWVVAATGWGLGNYTVQVVQEVADNASGWIESHPCQFEVVSKLSQVTEVSHTPTYYPAFSGRGFTGATVLFRDLDDREFAPAKVVANGRWSSVPPLEVGPTKDQIVVIHQTLQGQSAEPLNYVFSIPPLAPGLNDPQENGQSPIFTGTCWPGAEVVLAFNGVGANRATTQADKWRYEKPGGFAPGEYTISVIQIAAEQESVAVTRDFTVSRSMLKPQIDTPQEGAEVAADLVVTGSNGMAGASMQLRDAQYGNPLGQPVDLTEDGLWSINLTDLSLRPYTIDAQQTLEGQTSERSEMRAFEVTVLAPQITVPKQNGTMPRDGKILGTGWRGAHVEIWDVDANVQLASDIAVQPDGSWHWELKQSIGHHQIWARQTFAGIRSKESPTHPYSVVPNAPAIETPTAEDHVGRQVWVCGFGVPGDNVSVTLGGAEGEALVLIDRTWSVLLTLNVAGANQTLQVIASSGEFQSEPAVQKVAVGTYLPDIEAPQAGRRVEREPCFSGRGRPGNGQLVSWFNPEVIWLEQAPVTDGRWQGQSGRSLPVGGNWCWFQQTLSDVEGETVSERVLSSRFEVDAGDARAKQRR